MVPTQLEEVVEHQDQTSHALLGAAREGDRDSLESLLELHQPRLIGYFRARHLPEPLLAESLRNVFQTALASREPHVGETTIRTWLLELAGAELFRRAKKNQLPGGEPWAQLCLESDFEQAADEAELGYSDAAHRLPDLLAELDEADREALQMAYRDRHDRATLAEKLRRSETAVAVLLDRARRNLQEQLAQDHSTTSSRGADEQA